MNVFRVRFDEGAGMWSLRPLVGGDERPGSFVLAKRLIIDAPGETDGGSIVVRGMAKADELSSMAFEGAVANTLTVERQDRPEGVVNREAMIEWKIGRDSLSDCWILSRSDALAFVRSRHVNLNCRLESHGDELVATAEMILDGRTNRTQQTNVVDSVFLRTLRVFNQEVQVKPMVLKTKVKPPLGARKTR